jgi:hypothetical protein
VPTFADPNSAFPERQRELLAIGAIGDDRATVGTRRGQSARANAQNGQQAIIECRQEP